MDYVQRIDALPEQPLRASEAFFSRYLASSKAMASEAGVTSLTIVVPSAASSHDDWRRGVVRDLAREYRPVRINMIGASEQGKLEKMLAYLRNAPGVTGQYLAAHD